MKIHFLRKKSWPVIFGLLLWAGCGRSPAEEVPITTSSEEARALFLEGRILYENIRVFEARNALEAAIAADPGFAVAYYYRAMCATSLADVQRHLRHAVDLSSKVSDGEQLIIKAAQAGFDGDYDLRLALLTELVKAYPGDPRAHWMLGIAYTHSGDTKKSVAEYRQAIRLNPDYAPSYNQLGYAQFRTGDYKSSEKAFQNYIRLLPDEANPRDSMGDLYTKMGRYEEAIDQYKLALEHDPAFTFSKRKIAANLVFMDRYEDARAILLEALEQEPTLAGKVRTWLEYGLSYIYEDRLGEAYDAAMKARQIAAEGKLTELVLEICLALTRVHIDLDEFDRAETQLARCRAELTGQRVDGGLRINTLRMISFNEALLAAKRMDFDRAFALADSMLVLSERESDIRGKERYSRLLGQLYSEQGDYASAVKHLIQAEQGHPYSLYLLARAKEVIGETQSAKTLYQQVAQWNENGLEYALVRNKALAALERL